MQLTSNSYGVSQHGKSIPSVQATEEKTQECDHYEFRVLIIIFCLLRSLTTRLRSVNTIRMVSTTLWKLLAAPRSCVKRMMLSGCFLPCSITVITSAAKATSLRFKPASFVRCVPASSGYRAYNSQFLAATRAKTMLRSLSTCIPLIPYRRLRHSLSKMATSCRARLRDSVMQI